MVGIKPEIVVEQAKQAVADRRLYRCLTCDAINEWTIGPEMFKPGGSLYQLAVSLHGKPKPTEALLIPHTR